MHIVSLLSGGIDSTTLLWELRGGGHRVDPVTFTYGQIHAVEVDRARLIAPETEVLTFTDVRPSKPPIPDGHYADPSMRATVYPNRNLIMLSLAAGLGIVRGATAVAYAAHGGDHPIYPDCRPEFVEAANKAFQVGNWEPIELLAPFVNISKTDIVRRGAELGVPFALTWSCYRGGERHCGTCGTCVERREAFKLAGVSDPTVYL